MALQKFTQTLMNGIGTSPAGAVAHHRVAIRINTAIDAFESINRDASRTKSEKAVFYKQLQEQHGRAIQADLDKFAHELMARTESYEAGVSKVMNSVGLADAVQIVAGLKAAGLSSEQLLSAVRDSSEIAVAMARVPQALSGLTPDVATAAVVKHHPQLAQLGEENQRDFSSYESLSRVVDRTIAHIGLNVDQQALAERFDEAKLSPDPVPKTVAQEQAQMAKVVDPAFEQATNEQIAEHVGIYGYAHAKK